MAEETEGLGKEEANNNTTATITTTEVEEFDENTPTEVTEFDEGKDTVPSIEAEAPSPLEERGDNISPPKPKRGGKKKEKKGKERSQVA